MEIESQLVRLCLEAATRDKDSVEKWRRQRRSLEGLPSPLANALLRLLSQRRLLYPSLLEVFKHSVEEIDLRGENSVDAEWMAYLGAFRCLHSLNTADCHKVTSSALWALSDSLLVLIDLAAQRHLHLLTTSGMPVLKDLDLSRCARVTNAGIRHLLSISTLEQLHLSETGVTADGVTLLSSLANLSVLDLGGLLITDQALNSLKVLTKLQYLDLWGSKISDAGAAVLSIFPNLSFVNVAWTGVTRIPNLSSLRFLNVSNCTINSIFDQDGCPAPLEKLIVSGTSFVSESEALSHVELRFLTFLDISNSSLHSFYFLPLMKTLEHLDLSSTMMGDESVELVACIGAGLKNLNLSHTKVSSTGVEILAGHVPNLEVLSLSHTVIDDVSISFISMMPSLKTVDLSNTQVKGFVQRLGAEPDSISTLSGLQCLSHLKILNLEHTRVTDLALLPLSGLQNMSQLFLQSPSLTDSSLHHLSSFLKLKTLGLRDAVLTNYGLDSFKPPETLRTLDLRGCWLLTEDAISLFCRTHPQVGVKHEFVHAYTRDQPGSSRPSPSRLALVSSAVSQQRKELIFPYFVDQRLKYSREELLALQYSSLSVESASDRHPRIVPLELK